MCFIIKNFMNFRYKLQNYLHIGSWNIHKFYYFCDWICRALWIERFTACPDLLGYGSVRTGGWKFLCLLNFVIRNPDKFGIATYTSYSREISLIEVKYRTAYTIIMITMSLKSWLSFFYKDNYSIFILRKRPLL